MSGQFVYLGTFHTHLPLINKVVQLRLLTGCIGYRYSVYNLLRLINLFRILYLFAEVSKLQSMLINSNTLIPDIVSVT